MTTDNISFVKLESSDEVTFDVPRDIAEMSVTVRHMLEDIDNGDVNNAIPLANVTSNILGKIIEYCTYHKEHPHAMIEIEKSEDKTKVLPWDQEFCDVEQSTLFELMLAANYLDIKSLLDLTCKIVANMIKGKTPEEIRQTFNIVNDLSPEEEEQLNKENQWCMDL